MASYPGELGGDVLDEAHVAGMEAGVPGRGGGPDLAPDAAVHDDGNADVGLLAELSQKLH